MGVRVLWLVQVREERRLLANATQKIGHLSGLRNGGRRQSQVDVQWVAAVLPGVGQDLETAISLQDAGPLEVETLLLQFRPLILWGKRESCN